MPRFPNEYTDNIGSAGTFVIKIIKYTQRHT